jgi:uncharacterized protein
MQADPNRLRIWPDAETDYWQRTHYGFRVDNGHCLYAATEGPFVMTTCVSFEPVRSTQEVPGSLLRIWLGVERAGSEWSSDGSEWTQLRLGHLHEDDGLRSVAAGIYACSPRAAGYAADFWFLDIARSAS